MKKIISLFTALGLMLSGMAVLPEEMFSILVPVANATYTHGDYEYKVLDDGTVEISKYNGSGSEAIIPSTIDGRNVKQIGSYAFNGCDNLTSITIPHSVTSIGYRTFICKSLTSINIDSENNNYSSLDGVLYNKNRTELICCPCGKTSITIPNSVTSIGSYAFYYCNSLTSITIPNSVTNIGSNAFRCMNISSISIPDGVSTIGQGLFEGCWNLTSITIPNSVISIGSYAFYGCGSLSSITIPNSVKSIDAYAFWNCNSLTNITLPNSVTNIDNYAFYGCDSLTSITIPNSVTSIGVFAFRDCMICTIKCNAGSYAEKYAKAINHKYEIIDDSKEYDDNVIHNKTIEYQYEESQYFSDAKNLDFSFIYDDDWLFKDSTVVNGDIAKAAIGLASAAYKPVSLLSCFQQMGFNDAVNVNYLYTPTYDNNDHVCAAIAHKKINDYDVYLVPIKGTSSDCEWFSNFNLGRGPHHTGFHTAAMEVEKTLAEKLKADGAQPSKTIILLTGHSRGAAVANIIAGHLNRGLLEYNVFQIPKTQLFAYTFACPSVSEEANESLENIFNFNNPGDVVTSVPPTKEMSKNWNFKRNGKTIWLKTSGAVYERFLQGIYRITNGKTTYEGNLTTDELVNALLNVAPSQEAYNSKEDKAIFDILAFIMLKKVYQDKYLDDVIKNNSEVLIKGGAITLVGARVVFTFPLIRKLLPGVAIVTGLAIKDDVKTLLDNVPTIGHGHTATTYIEWVNATFYDEPTTHNHSYTSKVTKAATCKEPGMKTYSCSCGVRYAESIPKLTSHSFGDWLVTTAASCKAEGSETRTCSICGETETRAIAKSAHSYTSKVIAPTTTAQGYTLHTCTVCGTSYKDNYTNKIHTHSYTSKVTKTATCAATGVRTYTCSCGDSYTETIPKLTTHTFGNWSTTKAATCAAEGTQTRKCTVCGKTETKSIAKTTVHSYTNNVIAPTTTAQGYTLHTCSVCGASYKDNYTDKLAVHTHSYTSKVTKPATCAATGVRTYTCSCGDSYTETIPKLTTHTFGNWSVTTNASCKAEGTEARKCSVCGKTETRAIAKTAHSYTTKIVAPTTTAQGYTDHICSVCGTNYKDNYTDKLAVHTHSYTSIVTKAATCAATGIRTYTCACGDIYTETIPKLTTHTFGNWSVTTNASCKAEGTEARKCSICGKAETRAIAKTAHSYTTKIVAPTTTAQGYTEHTCSVCGDNYKDTYTAKLTPNAENISKATVTGIGAKTYTGKAITQSPVVKLGTTTLKNGTDYTVAYKNNTKVGTATVTITGKGSYTGTISKTFKINAASIAKATVSGLSNKTYTGKAITQNPTVKLGSTTLKKGTDYTVTFKNNKAVGTATVTIKGKGNYTGSISKTFKINPKKTTLKTATSPKTKQLKVTYSKVSGVTGYQTVYSTSSKFTKATTKTASSKNTSKTISGLTKGKTYYVKVRTYKTVKGTKYYSGYSAVKKIKIK